MSSLPTETTMKAMEDKFHGISFTDIANGAQIDDENKKALNSGSPQGFSGGSNEIFDRKKTQFHQLTYDYDDFGDGAAHDSDYSSNGKTNKRKRAKGKKSAITKPIKIKTSDKKKIICQTKDHQVNIDQKKKVSIPNSRYRWKFVKTQFP